jgi:uncharacterized protein YjbJ (UPF0337 family)
MFVFQGLHPAVEAIGACPAAPGTRVHGDERSKRPGCCRRRLGQKHHRGLVAPGEAREARERRRRDRRRNAKIGDNEAEPAGPQEQIGRGERRGYIGSPYDGQRREIDSVFVRVGRVEQRRCNGTGRSPGSRRMEGNPRRRFSRLLGLEDYRKRKRERGGVAGAFELHKPARQPLETPPVLARKRLTGGIESRIVNRSGQRDDHREDPIGIWCSEDSEHTFVMSTERTEDPEPGEITSNPLKLPARKVAVMDKSRFGSRWPDVRHRVKSNWSRLTDQELDQVKGDADTLISMIQEKYEEPRTSIEMQLERLLAA